ncbi:MAG: hypothetical protein H8E82_05320 [Candidatus Marinimicrobia bacterium]|nr:hypothetical protein [Candidatus Neomarinimicrobiota bacterium]MBL7046342.1 hypothetical protein [Candidatus Neomarinimicrobiota bacterium]
MDSFKIIDGKKFMWDGEDYESESAAKENASKYSKDGFETKLIEEGGKSSVFTRRVVTEVVVEGEPV